MTRWHDVRFGSDKGHAKNDHAFFVVVPSCRRAFVIVGWLRFSS